VPPGEGADQKGIFELGNVREVDVFHGALPPAYLCCRVAWPPRPGARLSAPPIGRMEGTDAPRPVLPSIPPADLVLPACYSDSRGARGRPRPVVEEAREAATPRAGAAAAVLVLVRRPRPRPPVPRPSRPARPDAALVVGDSAGAARPLGEARRVAARA